MPVPVQKEERPVNPLGQPARYWPGKAPSAEVVQRPKKVEKPKEAITIIKDDRRLARLKQAKAEKVDKDDAIARRRRVHEAAVVRVAETPVAEVIEAKQEEKPVSSITKVIAEEEDEQSLQKRRERIRQKLQARIQKEKEEEMAIEEEPEEEEEEGSSSEYETDSSDEDELFPSRPTIAPVFVSRDKRDTIREREAREEEEEKLLEKKEKQLEERKLESKQLVIEDLKKALEQTKVESDESETDSEEEDEEAEYEAWKQRELARIKRDKDEKERAEKERAEIERRRKMTDAEIKAENAMLNPEKPKKKYKFLQKYYHKGAFFHELLPEKDYAEATGEDKFDKTVLPSVMQVKNFGLRGRTKYTHLVDQDTTDWTSPWAAKKDSFQYYPPLAQPAAAQVSTVASLVTPAQAAAAAAQTQAQEAITPAKRKAPG